MVPVEETSRFAETLLAEVTTLANGVVTITTGYAWITFGIARQKALAAAATHRLFEFVVLTLGGALCGMEVFLLIFTLLAGYTNVVAYVLPSLYTSTGLVWYVNQAICLMWVLAFIASAVQVAARTLCVHLEETSARYAKEAGDALFDACAKTGVVLLKRVLCGLGPKYSTRFEAYADNHHDLRNLVTSLALLLLPASTTIAAGLGAITMATSLGTFASKAFGALYGPLVPSWLDKAFRGARTFAVFYLPQWAGPKTGNTVWAFRTMLISDEPITLVDFVPIINARPSFRRQRDAASASLQAASAGNPQHDVLRQLWGEIEGVGQRPRVPSEPKLTALGRAVGATFIGAAAFFAARKLAFMTGLKSSVSTAAPVKVDKNTKLESELGDTPVKQKTSEIVDKVESGKGAVLRNKGKDKIRRHNTVRGQRTKKPSTLVQIDGNSVDWYDDENMKIVNPTDGTAHYCAYNSAEYNSMLELLERCAEQGIKVLNPESTRLGLEIDWYDDLKHGIAFYSYESEDSDGDFRVDDGSDRRHVIEQELDEEDYRNRRNGEMFESLTAVSRDAVMRANITKFVSKAGRVYSEDKELVEAIRKAAKASSPGPFVPPSTSGEPVPTRPTMRVEGPGGHMERRTATHKARRIAEREEREAAAAQAQATQAEPAEQAGGLSEETSPMVSFQDEEKYPDTKLEKRTATAKARSLALQQALANVSASVEKDKVGATSRPVKPPLVDPPGEEQQAPTEGVVTMEASHGIASVNLNNVIPSLGTAHYGATFLCCVRISDKVVTMRHLVEAGPPGLDIILKLGDAKGAVKDYSIPYKHWFALEGSNELIYCKSLPGMGRGIGYKPTAAVGPGGYVGPVSIVHSSHLYGLVTSASERGPKGYRANTADGWCCSPVFATKDTARFIGLHLYAHADTNDAYMFTAKHVDALKSTTGGARLAFAD